MELKEPQISESTWQELADLMEDLIPESEWQEMFDLVEEWMPGDTWSDIPDPLEENKRLYEKLKTSKTPAERKELYGSIRFNSYLLGVLTRLTTGRIGEVPELKPLYEMR